VSDELGLGLGLGVLPKHPQRLWRPSAGQPKSTFRNELERLLNRCDEDNGFDELDQELAKFLTDCITAYDKAVKSIKDNHG
jgi:hypothetical protein